MFSEFETQQKKHITILQNGDPSISKGKKVALTFTESLVNLTLIDTINDPRYVPRG
jgi:hypothetical protein